MATFIKIDGKAGILILAAAGLLVWAFVFPESFQTAVASVGELVP